jgi:DNA-binding NarL/FixJ family response regulator
MVIRIELRAVKQGDHMSANGLLLSDDLIFTSRVLGTARDLGSPFRVAKSADALLAIAREQPPAGAIVDLSNPALNIQSLVAELKRLAPAVRVVAYGSHVDTATLKSAREAGCDLVMPRSQFVEELPRSLAAWLSPEK